MRPAYLLTGSDKDLRHSTVTRNEVLKGHSGNLAVIKPLQIQKIIRAIHSFMKYPAELRRCLVFEIECLVG